MLKRIVLAGCFVAILSAACDKSKPGQDATTPSASPAQPQSPSTNASPQPAPDFKPKSPHAKWKAEPAVYDFGTVWAGDMLTYPFRIINEGAVTLQILEAKPHCSCSVAENYSKEIAPGAAGVIPFKLNTSGKKGNVDEFLTIKTNEPERPEMALHMKGIVRQLVETIVVSDSGADQAPDPKAALAKLKGSAGSLGVIKADQKIKRSIMLKNTSGQSPLILKMHEIKPEGSRFTADFQELVPGEEYLLTIAGEPPFSPGQNLASVTLETNITGRPIYNVGVYAYVPGRIDVMPPKIVIDPGFPYIRERTIMITNYGAAPFQITGVSSSEQDYKITVVRPAQENPKQWKIVVMLPEPGYRPPSYGELIRVHTDDAELKVIDIEVLPYVDRPATMRPNDKPIHWRPIPMP